MTDSSTTTAGAVFGAGPVIANSRSRGTYTSNLAQQLAPPASPRFAPLVNTGIIVLIVIAVCTISLSGVAMRSTNSPSTRHGGLVFLLIGIGLLVVSLLAATLDRWRRFDDYRRVWPAYMYVWRNSMVCLRCYVVFFPVGALPAGLGISALIPVDAFQAAVTDIADRLAAADPGKYA